MKTVTCSFSWSKSIICTASDIFYQYQDLYLAPVRCFVTSELGRQGKEREKRVGRGREGKRKRKEEGNLDPNLNHRLMPLLVWVFAVFFNYFFTLLIEHYLPHCYLGQGGLQVGRVGGFGYCVGRIDSESGRLRAGQNKLKMQNAASRQHLTDRLSQCER